MSSSPSLVAEDRIARIAQALDLPRGVAHKLKEFRAYWYVDLEGWTSVAFGHAPGNFHQLNLRPVILELKIKAAAAAPVARIVTRARSAAAASATVPEKVTGPKWEYKLTLIAESSPSRPEVHLESRGVTSDLLNLLTDSRLVAQFADAGVRQAQLTPYVHPFGMCQANGHWKKSYEEFDGNMFVLTDTIWENLVDEDGWLAEYVLLLCFAGVVDAHDNTLPPLPQAS
jgi:hypothetical protein